MLTLVFRLGNEFTYACALIGNVDDGDRIVDDVL